MRSPDQDYVALKPPLPFIDGERGPGFVHALAADRLLIEFAAATASSPPTTGPCRLTVSLGVGKSYAFNGALTDQQPATAAGLHEAKVEDLAGRAHLADLRNVVRKGQHISLCETGDVEASDRYTGFSDLELRPLALPELAWHELDTRQQFLGYQAKLPLLITGMTGGLTRGAEINRRLARAAAHFGVPMGVGSQRVALENPEHAAIFAVKKHAPSVFLIGNIGIAQLRGANALDDCRRAVDMIDADALAVHVNVLQELIQVEGDRDFRGLIDRVAEVAAGLGVPVMVKEVGGGIDPRTAALLLDAGVKAIDCGGKGGTSWSYIEGLRAQSPVTRAVAETFRDFGIPTAVAVAALRRSFPEVDLVATGGVRDGLSVAKAMGLRATLAGVGLPLLRAALAGDEQPFEVLETLAQGLKTAMMCTGARSLSQLPARLIVGSGFVERLAGVVDGQGH